LANDIEAANLKAIVGTTGHPMVTAICVLEWPRNGSEADTRNDEVVLSPKLGQKPKEISSNEWLEVT
jgi:hypothetical protein